RPLTGLDRFAPEDRPPVVIPFITYHIMAGLGGFFVVLTLYALFLRWRGTLFEKRWLMWVFVFAVIGPYLANECGWIAAEVGRQPFIVYGEMRYGDHGLYCFEGGLRTADAISQAVPAEQILVSILMYTFIYLLLLAVWVYVVHSKIQHGPEEAVAFPQEAKPTDLLEAMARRSAASGYSMTAVPEEPTEAPSEGR